MQNHSYKNDFENETACRTHFHMKTFALRLVLKPRHKRIRKWPIVKFTVKGIIFSLKEAWSLLLALLIFPLQNVSFLLINGVIHPIMDKLTHVIHQFTGKFTGLLI